MQSTSTGYDQRIEVFGSKGGIAANNLSATRTKLFCSAGVIGEKPFYSFVERYREAYQRQLQAFFDAVHSGTSPLVNADDAQKAVAVAIAANQSLRDHRLIQLR